MFTFVCQQMPSMTRMQWYHDDNDGYDYEKDLGPFNASDILHDDCPQAVGSMKTCNCVFSLPCTLIIISWLFLIRHIWHFLLSFLRSYFQYHRQCTASVLFFLQWISSPLSSKRKKTQPMHCNGAKDPFRLLDVKALRCFHYIWDWIHFCWQQSWKKVGT